MIAMPSTVPMDQMAGSQLSDPALSLSMVDMTRPPDVLGRDYIPRLFQDDYVRRQNGFVRAVCAGNGRLALKILCVGAASTFGLQKAGIRHL
jgi:hypothetical protein